MICRRPSYISDLETDDRYEQVTSFLTMCLNIHSHLSEISFLNQSVLFLRDMTAIIADIGAGNGNDFVTDLPPALEKALNLRNLPFVPSVPT